MNSAGKVSQELEEVCTFEEKSVRMKGSKGKPLEKVREIAK